MMCAVNQAEIAFYLKIRKKEVTILATAVLPAISSAVSKRIEVSAVYTSPHCINARYAEDHFADVVGEVISPYSCEVSNWGVGDQTSEGWPVHTLVRREPDTGSPEVTEKVLRELTPVIKAVLRSEYENIEVVLITKVTTLAIL